MGLLADARELTGLLERQLDSLVAQREASEGLIRAAEGLQSVTSRTTFAPPPGPGGSAGAPPATVGTGGGGAAGSGGSTVSGQRQTLAPAEKLTGSDGQTRMSIEELDAAVAAGFASKDDTGSVIIWRLGNGVLFFLGKVSLGPLSGRSSGGTAGSGSDQTNRTQVNGPRSNDNTPVTYAGSPTGNPSSVSSTATASAIDPVKLAGAVGSAVARELQGVGARISEGVGREVQKAVSELAATLADASLTLRSNGGRV